MATDKQNMSAQSPSSHTAAIASAIGPKLNGVIASLIQKGQEVSAGPLTVLENIRLQYDAKFGEGKGDEMLLQDFPRLDTTYESGTNAHTEIYQGEKPNESGEMKTRNLNFFTELWEQFDEGKSQVFVLRQCKLAASKDAAKAEEKFRAMSVDALENLRKRTNNAKTKGRGYLRKAAGVFHTMCDLADITDQNGEPVVTLTFADDWERNDLPLNLIDKTRLRKYRPLPIGDVLRLDVAAAKADGGNLYDALEKQLSRSSGGGKGKIPQLNSIELWCDAALKMYNAVNQEEQSGKDMVAAITKRMAQKKGGELLVRAIGELRLALNEFWSDSMQVRFQRQLDEEVERRVEDADDEKAAA